LRTVRLRYIAWAGSIAIAVLALLLPALLNGFPLVFADTGGYIARPFERTLALRSALYGTFVAATIPFYFWPVIVGQAGLTTWLFAITLRVHDLKGPVLLGSCVGILAVFTSLPWYVGQLMPDIFVPLAVLALHLLAFGSGKLRRAIAESW